MLFCFTSWPCEPCGQLKHYCKFWLLPFNRTIVFAFWRSRSLSFSFGHFVGPLCLSNISQQFMELLYINMCFVCPCRLCSATLVDLQLLSNTYCQASETCSLSFARHRPANSTCYINKKNSCCYACQDPARVSLWERVRGRDVGCLMKNPSTGEIQCSKCLRF